jgi:hypothetical protein
MDRNKHLYGYKKWYLSYSALDLWRSSKTQYRKRYYLEEPEKIENKYTRFGKKVHGWIENGLLHLPDYPDTEFTSEYRIIERISGIPIMAYIDLYDPITHRFADVKTGKSKWTPSKVQKLDQLPIYSLLIQQHTGHVTDECAVVWIGTECHTPENTSPFAGAGQEEALRLTGDMAVLKRTVDQDERNRWRERIVTLASEIEKDYQDYKNNNY